MDSKRIVWMMDEALVEVHPRDWKRAITLEEKLVRLIGNPEMNHVVVHPLESLYSLVPSLENMKFSCVLDLTGWMTPIINELFPGVLVEDRLALSRVRVVSSPRLETTGYVLSLSQKEINEIKKELDMSRPLIIDDVSFSGWTSKKTMDLWGIDPEVTTHAFLIANKGKLGKSPGAVELLESVGSRVLYGHGLDTPSDDGWHLKDLHKHPCLSEAFELSMLFQELVSDLGVESEEVSRFFRRDGVLQTLFPGSLESSAVLKMIEEDKFILLNGNTLSNETIHTKNPFLWASLYLRDHLNIEGMRGHKDEILSVITELQSLSMDPESRREAQSELGREVSMMRQGNIEGCVGNIERR